MQLSLLERQQLAQGQALQQAGRSAEAAAILLPLAQKHRASIDAQMLAAFAARGAGDFRAAIACLKRALDCRVDDPQIGNILANTLAAAGERGEALALLNRICQRNPTFLDAHVNRALTAEEAGDGERALELVDRSLAGLPDQPRLLAIRGALLKNLGRVDEALPVLQRACALDPARALTHFNRGVTLRAMERHAEALEAYAEAERLGLKGPQLVTARAAALLETGAAAQAQALYEQAFAAGDPDGEAGPALARIRKEYLGDPDPVGHYGDAARARPDDLGAWLRWLAAQVEYDDWQGLRAAGREALARFPYDRDVAAMAALGEAWAGNRAEGIGRLLHLAEDDGAGLPLVCSLAELLLMEGEAKLAEAHALRATRIAPLDQSGWAWLATAWRLLDDPREEWLCDYERFVLVEDVLDPQWGDDREGFAAHMTGVLGALHATVHAPGNQSLRHGTQTSGALFARRDAEIMRFRTAIEAALLRGVARLPDDPGNPLTGHPLPHHPLLGRKPTGAVRFMGSWSVRLRGGGGHHVSHYHTDGWMSSACYVHLPPTLGTGTGADDHAGHIQFGSPPAHMGLNLPPRRVVRPETGRLAMFPSYMWHGTLPFDGDDFRMTAAFDFVPG